MGSNHRPSDYESDALTVGAKGPNAKEAFLLLRIGLQCYGFRPINTSDFTRRFLMKSIKTIGLRVRKGRAF
jgi:hypothetical protein